MLLSLHISFGLFWFFVVHHSFLVRDSTLGNRIFNLFQGPDILLEVINSVRKDRFAIFAWFSFGS